MQVERIVKGKSAASDEIHARFKPKDVSSAVMDGTWIYVPDPNGGVIRIRKGRHRQKRRVRNGFVTHCHGSAYVVRKYLRTGAPEDRKTTVIPISRIGKRSKRMRIGTVCLLIVLSLLMGSIQSSGAQGLAIEVVKPGDIREKIELYSGFYALVMGCGDYEHWPKSETAVENAKKASEWLQKNGWEVDFVENPKRNDVIQNLQGAFRKLSRQKMNAFLIWFSGRGYTHESQDGQKEGYLVPIDAPDPGKDEEAFLNALKNSPSYIPRLEMLLKKYRPKHIILLLDACVYDSSFQTDRKFGSGMPISVEEPVREFVIACTEEGDAPPQSLFHLVFEQGFDDKKADLDQDGYITGHEIQNYLMQGIEKGTIINKKPYLAKSPDPDFKKGDFVFAVKDSVQKTVQLVPDEVLQKPTDSEAAEPPEPVPGDKTPVEVPVVAEAASETVTQPQPSEAPPAPSQPAPETASLQVKSQETEEMPTAKEAETAPEKELPVEAPVVAKAASEAVTQPPPSEAPPAPSQPAPETASLQVKSQETEEMPPAEETETAPEKELPVEAPVVAKAASEVVTQPPSTEAPPESTQHAPETASVQVKAQEPGETPPAEKTEPASEEKGPVEATVVAKKKPEAGFEPSPTKSKAQTLEPEGIPEVTRKEPVREKSSEPIASPEMISKETLTILEIAYWNSVDQDSRSQLSLYLSKFPEGSFSEMAKLKLEDLDKQEELISKEALKNAEGTVQAEKSLGSLEIRTNVPGAGVFLDGTDFGVAPVTINDVESGSHRIRISKGGYELWETQIQTENGIHALIRADIRKLPPEKGRLFIETQPKEAKIAFYKPDKKGHPRGQ